jgi:hypothetical protein
MLLLEQHMPLPPLPLLLGLQPPLDDTQIPQKLAVKFYLYM